MWVSDGVAGIRCQAGEILPIFLCRLVRRRLVPGIVRKPRNCFLGHFSTEIQI